MIRLNQTTAIGTATALVLLVAAGAGPQPRVVRFLGNRAAKTLAEATRVEVFSVKDKRAAETQKAVGGYVIDAAGKEQGEAFARRVADVLLDEKSYRFEAGPTRGFKPTVGMRVWARQRWVEVLLSPSTEEVVVFSPNGDDGSVRSAQADVAPAREALTALVKESLPEDEPQRAQRAQRKEK